MLARHHPASLGELEAGTQVVLALQGNESGQGRAEVLHFAELGSAVDPAHQLAGIGIGHRAAVRLVERHLRGGRDPVPSEGGREVVQGEVGAYHRIAAAGAGQGGADRTAGKEHIGRCGDRSVLLQGPVVPGAASGVIALLEFLAADDLVELVVVEEGQ
ncbi:hypothetical protein D3C85_636190 [compost metagenome]